MKYLLDTNACIVFLKNKNAMLINRVHARHHTDIVLCSVVVGELLYGTERSSHPVREKAKVDSFAAKLSSFPFDDSAARVYAQVKYDLEKRGLPIGENDLQIAAIALDQNLTLVTHNTAEFSRIPNLNIEDWEVP